MRLVKLAIITLFCSSCYSANWGACNLTPYFYTSSIERLDVYFHSVNKFSISFDKENNYWGVSLFKISKSSTNELLKGNSLSSDELSVGKLVHKNYLRLLKQDLFHIVKKTEEFSIPSTPVTLGLLINAMVDPEMFENSELRDFSITVQEYENHFLFIKMVVTSDGELPSVADVKEVVQQFRNSCTIYDV
jgi:hypothetical protein